MALPIAVAGWWFLLFACLSTVAALVMALAVASRYRCSGMTLSIAGAVCLFLLSACLSTAVALGVALAMALAIAGAVSPCCLHVFPLLRLRGRWLRQLARATGALAVALTIAVAVWLFVCLLVFPVRLLW